MTINTGTPLSRLDYSFRSLISALRVMLVQDVASADHQVRICPECSKVFVGKDPRVRYCGEKCSNRARQRRFRNKNKPQGGQNGKRKKAER